MFCLCLSLFVFGVVGRGCWMLSRVVCCGSVVVGGRQREVCAVGVSLEVFVEELH